jgi:hypothetical protein
MARDRPIVQKWLSSAGNAAGTVLGGIAGHTIAGPEGGFAGAIAGAFVGQPVFDELGRHLPERISEWDGRWPRRVNGRPRLITYSELQLLSQLERDFSHSHMSSREKVVQDCDEAVAKAFTMGNVPSLFLKDAGLLSHRYPATPEGVTGVPDQEAVRSLRSLKNVISISCQPVMPAILASLIDMRDRLKIPLYIHHPDMSGVAQVAGVIQRLHQNNPFDLAFVPNAAFLRAKYRGRSYDLSAQYAFAMPVHYQWQHLVRRPHKNRYEGLNGIDYVRFLADGSAHEQYRDVKRHRKMALTEDPFTLDTYEKILDFGDLNIAVGLWEPLSQYALRSGKFVSIDQQRYRYWMSAFLKRNVFHEEHKIRALVSVFANSWMHCSANLDYASDLLRSEAIIGDFEKAGKQTSPGG